LIGNRHDIADNFEGVRAHMKLGQLRLDDKTGVLEVTSSPVKFLGAFSWAIHMMRRPSRVSWIDIPSPMPPKPPSSC
jgi:hypothetical protein